MTTIDQWPASIEIPLPARLDPGFHIRQSKYYDRDKLVEFFSALSASARSNRFLCSIASVSSAVIEMLAGADQINHVALIATRRIGNREIIVAEARFVVCDSDRAAAEFALTVADDWQGQGIGHRLLGLVEALARQRNVRALWGDTSPANAAMISLASRLGFDRRRHPQDFKLARLEKTIVV